MAPVAPSALAKYSAEFLGTFMLVFTVCLIKTAGGTDAGLELFGPTAVGFVLMVLVYALGPISGAHLNPAVTFAIWLQKGIAMSEAIMYLGLQCGAGFLAGVAAASLYGFKGMETGFPGPEFALGAPLVEFFYTFMLCFVVLNVCVAEKSKGNNYYGVAIGFVVIAGGYGGGFVSGGAFNPAITCGVSVIGLSFKSLWLPLYAAFQLAGAFMAVVAFHIVRPEEKKEGDPDHAHWSPSRLAHFIEGKFDPEDTAECLGTFFLTLSVSLNAMAGGKVSGMANGNPGAPWSIAASLTCMIMAVGNVSGGLFNPAVTLACLARWYGTGLGFGKDKLIDPKVSPKEGPKYLIAQLIGAAAGAGIVTIIWAEKCALLTKNGHQIYPAAGVAPAEGQSLGQAFFAEFLASFVLCFVVLCVGTTKNPLKEYTAFAIGGCIVAGGYAFGPISGGVINPAVAIANSAFHELQFIYTLAPIAYVGAQLLGGLFAAGIFKFVTHPHEYDDEAGAKSQPLLLA